MPASPAPNVARRGSPASAGLLIVTSLATLALAVQSAVASPWPSRGVTLALAGCLLLSVWSPRLGSRCASCDAAAALVGALPVALLGALLYAALFTLAALGRAPALLCAGLWAATGAHAALLTMLVRTRVTCLPCVATALLAFVATGLDAAQGGHAFALALAPLAAFATFAAARTGRAWAEAASAASVRRLAARFAEERAAPAEGHLRVVVYKREGCAACGFYDDEVRPALIEALWDRLELEERDVGTERAATPLFLVRGGAGGASGVIVAIVGLHVDGGLERLLAAIERAGATGADAERDAVGGVRVIDVG